MGQSIFAPTTALGGPVVIVRISGQDLSACHKLLGDFPAPGQFLLKNVVDPTCDNRILDKALVLFSKAPKSFTGEDVLEIQMHGVQSLVERLYQILESFGYQFALPGEFSFRAVKNGRMGIGEAEALQQAFAVDGISTEVAAQLIGISREIEESLNTLIQTSISKLQAARGRVEAGIDFSEAEEEQSEDLSTAQQMIADTKQALLRLSGSHESFARSSGEFRVAIVGSPNVGKSTLFNTLCGVDRALVSEIAGTTRDVIDVRVKSPSGIVFRIFDTAGIREDVSDEIERKGIFRGLEWLNRADLIVHVVKKGMKEDPSELFKKSPDLTLVSFSEWNSPRAATPVSAATRFRLEADLLRDANQVQAWMMNTLDQMALARRKAQNQSNAPAIVSDRQGRLLRTALFEISQAEQALIGNRPLEMAGDHLKRAEESLVSVLGRDLSDEYIGEIFSQFCLGK